MDKVEVFKNGLDATAGIAGALAGYCKTVEELVSVINLALANEAQLRILLGLVADYQKRQQQGR